MPGVPPDAFHLLEQSFQDARFNPFYPLQHISPPPRRTDHAVEPYKRPVARTFSDSADSTDDGNESDVDLHDGFSNTTPPARLLSRHISGLPPTPPAHFLSRHNSGLPPTPPSKGDEELDSARLSPPPHFADGVRNALHASKSSGLNTPPNPQRPPTPDSSPAGTQELLVLSPPVLQHYPSSKAESFQTARETMSANGSTSQVHLPEEDRLPQHWLDSTRAMRLANSGLGGVGEPYVVSGDETGSDITPTRRRNVPLIDIDQYVQYTNEAGYAPKGLGLSSYEENAEKDRKDREKYARTATPPPPPPQRETPTHSLRNVTVRRLRPRRPATPEQQKHVAPEAREAKRLSLLRDLEALQTSMEEPWSVTHTDLTNLHTQTKRTNSDSPASTPANRRFPSLRERVAHAAQSPPTPSGESFARDIAWPPASSPASKRLSMAGTVAAVVVPSVVPATKRTLRHSSKCASLRSMEGEDSAVGARRLRHTTAHLPERRRVVSAPAKGAEGTMPLSGPHTAHSLRHQNRPLSSYAQPAVTAAQTLRDGPAMALAKTADVREVLVGRGLGAPPALAEKRRSLGIVAEWSPRVWPTGFDDAVPEPESAHKLRRWSADERLKNNMAAQRTSSEQPVFEAGVTLARGEHQRLRRISGLKNNIAVPRMSLDQPVLDTAGELAVEGREHQRLRRVSDDEWVEQNSARVVLGGRESDQHAAAFSHDRSLSASTTAGATSLMYRSPHEPRASMDEHTALPTSPKRVFSDSSANPRFLLASTTPMSASQLSDRTEMGEICEAHGVSLFPHRHGSLLVVQQGAPRPVELTEERSRALSSPQQSLDPQLQRPLFAAVLEPSNPPLLALNNTAVHSPLRNPRAAPRPPVIVTIPPTPAEELDRELHAPLRDPAAAARPAPPRRRLSIVQKARRYSTSLLRSTSQRREPSMGRAEPGGGQLHPLWRPRAFWEESSDDDEGDEEGLPAGGDTREVPEGRGVVGGQSRFARLPLGILGNSSSSSNASGSYARKPHAAASATGPHDLRKRASRDSLRRVAGAQRRRTFAVPGLGVRVEYVGLAGFRERMQQRRERESERRRVYFPRDGSGRREGV